MNNYVIFTDSGCDIKPALLRDWGVDSRSLVFRFNDSDKEYTNDDMPVEEFYQKMRDGGVAKTSAVNVDSFLEAFEAHLSEGCDVLYLGFSGGLSTTSNSARVAAGELVEKYPERKVLVVDTLCASAGQGLLLKIVVDKKNAGATIEEAAKFAEDIKLKIAHCFNESAAKKLCDAVISKFPKANVSISTTGALCSFYAEPGGMLIGFEV